MSTPKSKPAKARRKRTKGGKASRRGERALAGIAREARREETAQEQARLKLAARERRVLQEQADRAAAERRRRAEQRDRDRNRQRWTILDLLRRGAGVTQILQTIAEPADTPSDGLRRAQQLRRILEQIGSSPATPAGCRSSRASSHAPSTIWIGSWRGCRTPPRTQRRDTSRHWPTRPSHPPGGGTVPSGAPAPQSHPPASTHGQQANHE